MDANNELGQRLQAFANRASWFAPLGLDQSYAHQLNYMIQHFGEMGVVEMRDGLPGDPHFPATMQVQDGRPAAAQQMLTPGAQQNQIDAEEMTDLSQIEKVQRFS